MGSDERREKIIRILSRRGHETIFNLAFELGVSTRTIRRDIDALSVNNPIYTQPGRYGGGIYILDNYIIGKFYISDKESATLKKLYLLVEKFEEEQFSVEEREILRSIIKNYCSIVRLLRK